MVFVDGALPADQIGSFTQCLQKDSPTTTMSQSTADASTTEDDTSLTTAILLEVDSAREDTTSESTATLVPKASKESLSDLSGVTVQNPSPTRIFVPNATLLESLATKTQDNAALFKELSTPHNINIDSDANSLQSTESEIVSVASQSATDDINDNVSEITTTYNSAILSKEPIAQSQYDTTQKPLTHSSEEALSDVSKKVFTTLNPRIEEITDSSHADRAWAFFDATTIDSQSPETGTSTSIVSQSSTADSDHINMTYQHTSQHLVTETFESTLSDINYSTSPGADDQSPVVTNQDAFTTEDNVTKGMSKVSTEIKETTTTFQITGESDRVEPNITITVEPTTSINHPKQSDNSSSISPSSSLSPTESLNIDGTTMLSVSTTLKANTEVLDTDGAKTTQKLDNAHDSTDSTLDHTKSQSVSEASKDMRLITTTMSIQASDGYLQETTSNQAVGATSVAGTDLISFVLNNTDGNPSQVPFEDLKEVSTSSSTTTTNTAGRLLTMLSSQAPLHDPEGTTSTASRDQLVPSANLTTDSPHDAPGGTSNSRVTQTPAQLNYNPDSTETILTENYTSFNTYSHKKNTVGNLSSTNDSLVDTIDDEGTSTIAPASYPNNSPSDTPSPLSSTPIRISTTVERQSYSPETGDSFSTITSNIGRMHIQSTSTSSTATTTAVKNDAIIDGFNSTFHFPITNISSTTSSSKALITPHANTTEDTNSFQRTTAGMEESSLGLFDLTTRDDGGGNEISTENPEPLTLGVGDGDIVTDNGKMQTREFVTSSTPIAVSTVTHSTQSKRNGLLEETTVLPHGNMTVTIDQRTTTMEWANDAYSKTSTVPTNSTGMTVPTGSVILGEKTSNVGKNVTFSLQL